MKEEVIRRTFGLKVYRRVRNTCLLQLFRMPTVMKGVRAPSFLFPRRIARARLILDLNMSRLSSPNGLARSKISKLILPQSVVLVPKVENFNQNVVMLLKKLN